jgi:hypothetical protein
MMKGASHMEGRASLRVVALLAGASLVLACLFFARAARQHIPSASPPLAEIRGEPINPVARTNSPSLSTTNAANVVAFDTTLSATSRHGRKHPKPASFAQRIVEFQVSQAEGNNTQTTLGGNPAKVVFTRAQLDALSEPPLPAGYERLGFETLSSFPFELTRGMADGSNNLAAASAATREKIPKAVQALDSHLVAIRGFLLPLRMNNGLTIEFLLMRNQNMCCFGSVPKINEWISVEPDGEGVKPIMDQPITVMGRLRVGEIRENGYLVGIYKMQAAQVYIHGAN